MTYKVEFSNSVRKQFRKLSPDIQKRVQAKINELIIEPRPSGVKKLQGDDNLYRIRVGDYRIIYEIEDDVLLVIVIRVKHRSKIYRDDS